MQNLDYAASVKVDTDVVIIGAGMSGICFGAQMIRWYNNRNFEIYEQNETTSESAGASGTWYVNQYPEAGVDVPSQFYSFSFHQNPNWSKKFCMRTEIQDYLDGMSRMYGLPEQMTFGVHCKGAQWDEAAQVWRVHLLDRKTGKEFERVCRVFISAVGVLTIPRECTIKGIDKFKGSLFHSAKWDHSVEIANNDVIVIGNGCSATQFVPAIAKEAKTVTQFARQPHWVHERENPTYSEMYKWILRNVPLVQRLVRFYYYADMEKDFLMFYTDTGKAKREALRAETIQYVQRAAPPKYHNMLVPSYEIGCKRRVFDTFYYDCLWRDNVQLTNDPIVEIKEHSVITGSGKEYFADTIILANGFATEKMLVPMEIQGRNMSLNDHWNQQGGPQAFLGTCFTGFPNFYALVGVNTATGHLSVIYTSECQVNFILRHIKPILDRDATSRMVTEEAEMEDNRWIQNGLKKLVFSTGCSSWYLDPDSGRNAVLYPHFQWHFWLRTIFIRQKDFITVWTKKGNMKRWMKRATYTFVIVSAMYLSQSKQSRSALVQFWSNTQTQLLRKFRGILNR